jgi:hypothetical protein
MSHQAEVLKFLKENGSITPMEALSKIGCYRLAPRIFELRDQGHKIETELTRVGKQVRSRYIYMGKKNAN